MEVAQSLSQYQILAKCRKTMDMGLNLRVHFKRDLMHEGVSDLWVNFCGLETLSKIFSRKQRVSHEIEKASSFL
jgi:hypothetical protein